MLKAAACPLLVSGRYIHYLELIATRIPVIGINSRLSSMFKDICSINLTHDIARITTIILL